MKVLHVIPSFAPAWSYGGPVFSALGLTKHLARQGHDITVMTTNRNGAVPLDVPLGQPVLLDGVKVWYFDVPYLRFWFCSPSLGAALHNHVKQFDLVHIHSIYLWPTTVAAYWSHRFGIPYVLSPTGMLRPSAIKKAYAGRLASLATQAKKSIYFETAARIDLRRACRCHFTCEEDQREAESLGIPLRGFVVPWGVDPSEAVDSELASRELWHRYPKLTGKIVILFLARLDPVKGLELLIEAMSKLSKRRDDLAVLIAGSGDPDYEKRLRELVRQASLEEHVVFSGMVLGKDKDRLLNGSDIFALPSYHENFGIAVVEAMRAGRPVVVSRHVGVSAEVGQAGAGITTEQNAEEIANAISRLADDVSLRREMGRRGVALVESRYSWPSVARQMGSWYERILVESGKGSESVV